MPQSSLSLVHQVVQPRQTTAEQPPVVFFLHGVGANEHDLLGVSEYLDPRLLIISVRAPRTYQYGGYSWFDIHWNARGFSIDTAQAQASWEHVQHFIAEAVQTYNADPNRVYLAGFSQGAIISLGATLTKPTMIAGLILMSGRWMPEIGPQADRDHIANKPIIVTHGLYDQVIPIQYGRAIRDFLETLPVDLTYHEYPMGHEINGSSLRDIVRWLTRQLDRQ